MTESTPTSAPIFQLRVWHLGLLVLFVAIAIVNIQDQRLEDPKLIALAAAGFVLYWILGWLGWRFARRFEARLGALPVLILYLTAMAALFLIASGIFLMIMLAYTK
jgi:hypothetical protein